MKKPLLPTALAVFIFTLIPWQGQTQTNSSCLKNACTTGSPCSSYYDSYRSLLQSVHWNPASYQSFLNRFNTLNLSVQVESKGLPKMSLMSKEEWCAAYEPLAAAPANKNKNVWKGIYAGYQDEIGRYIYGYKLADQLWSSGNYKKYSKESFSGVVPEAPNEKIKAADLIYLYLPQKSAVDNPAASRKAWQDHDAQAHALNKNGDAAVQEIKNALSNRSWDFGRIPEGHPFLSNPIETTAAPIGTSLAPSPVEAANSSKNFDIAALNQNNEETNPLRKFSNPTQMPPPPPLAPERQGSWRPPLTPRKSAGSAPAQTLAAQGLSCDNYSCASHAVGTESWRNGWNLFHTLPTVTEYKSKNGDPNKASAVSWAPASDNGGSYLLVHGLSALDLKKYADNNRYFVPANAIVTCKTAGENPGIYKAGRGGCPIPMDHAFCAPNDASNYISDSHNNRCFTALKQTGYQTSFQAYYGGKVTETKTADDQIQAVVWASPEKDSQSSSRLRILSGRLNVDETTYILKGPADFEYAAQGKQLRSYKLTAGQTVTFIKAIPTVFCGTGLNAPELCQSGHSYLK